MENRQFLDLDTKEEFMECRILDGNPSGIINFNKTHHKWAASLYDTMLERTWFPGHINVSQDKAKYGKLDVYQKRTYDLVLSQLISNDSFQTVQLDKINEHITSPVVNACLTRQAFEESLHSKCYAIMAEDIAEDTDRIYEMHKHDQELMLKNKSVQNMYMHLYGKKKLDNEDLLTIFCANQILEELVFPGGFAMMLSLADEMPGSGQMIAEINTHGLSTVKAVA